MTERQLYTLEVCCLKATGRQGGPDNRQSSCILGIVGSNVSGAYQGLKCRDISASAALILTVLSSFFTKIFLPGVPTFKSPEYSFN